MRLDAEPEERRVPIERLVGWREVELRELSVGQDRITDEPGAESLAYELDRRAEVYGREHFERLGPQGSRDHRADANALVVHGSPAHVLVQRARRRLLRCLPERSTF